MTRRTHRPYLGYAEERLHVIKVDHRGLRLLRSALMALATDPRGLDPTDTWKDPLDAEDLIRALDNSLPGSVGQADRTSRYIEEERQRLHDNNQRITRESLMLMQVRRDHPEVYAEIEAQIDVLYAQTLPEPEPEPEPATGSTST